MPGGGANFPFTMTFFPSLRKDEVPIRGMEAGEAYSERIAATTEVQAAKAVFPAATTGMLAPMTAEPVPMTEAHAPVTESVQMTEVPVAKEVSPAPMTELAKADSPVPVMDVHQMAAIPILAAAIPDPALNMPVEQTDATVFRALVPWKVVEDTGVQQMRLLVEQMVAEVMPAPQI